MGSYSKARLFDMIGQTSKIDWNVNDDLKK